MTFIKSPNFHTIIDRQITAIIIHYTGAITLEGTVSWFKKKESKVSAHYVISRDGEIIQMVEDKDVAWHAGVSWMPGTGERVGKSVNAFTIGIELVGTADSGFTASQMMALEGLIVKLVKTYKIKSERVLGHCDVAPGRKIDPNGFTNQFNWPHVKMAAEFAYNSVKET